MSNEVFDILMKVKYASSATSSSDKEGDKSDNKDRKEHLNKLGH